MKGRVLDKGHKAATKLLPNDSSVPRFEHGCSQSALADWLAAFQKLKKRGQNDKGMARFGKRQMGDQNANSSCVLKRGTDRVASDCFWPTDRMKKKEGRGGAGRKGQNLLGGKL